MDTAVLDYLLTGDPAIRWQTMRDLLDAPEHEWRAEREKVATDGWGPRFLACQLPGGTWEGDRWLGTVWTLCTLVDLGMPSIDPLKLAFDRLVGRLMPKGEAVTTNTLLAELDQCHLGFWLRAGSAFAPDDERLRMLAEALFEAQFVDGGWNCRIRTVPKTRHSSFHTIFNVLEGLREAAHAGIVDTTRFKKAEERAIEFMLTHRMCRSDRTGEVVSERFLHLSYPSYWHYTVIRGLDYIQGTPFIRDGRLAQSLEELVARQKPNGRWPVEKRIPGLTHFDMEPMGKDSRWNTLRALRILRAAGRPA